jgi:hypothetical protein
MKKQRVKHFDVDESEHRETRKLLSFLINRIEFLFEEPNPVLWPTKPKKKRRGLK